MISGASRGIGKEIALKALKLGHNISLGVRNPKDLEGTDLDPKKSGQERIMINEYEATDNKTTKEWVERTISKFNTFDSLIHCAGIFKKTELLFRDGEEADIKELLNVNLLGPWILTRECWEILKSSESGRIVFMVSMSGKRSKGNLAGYSSSKFALMSLCQTIRNEGWGHGIKVTAICPSWVNTDMAAGVKSIPKANMTQPGDIASLTFNLLDLPDSCVPFELLINCNLENR